MEYKIRGMRVEDLEFAARCTAIEGWLSETAQDFENFLAFDPEGCFVAEVDGKPVGICIAVNYGHIGFIGELVVLRDFRGNKIGSGLLNHSIDYLRSSGAESIYLDADHKAVSLYESENFVHVCKSLRFTGRIDGKPDFNVHPISQDDLPEIFKIDIALFGSDRTYFLERKYKLFPNLCKVYKQNGVIKGYVFAKNSNGVISVGPWTIIDPSINPLSMLEVISYEQGKINFRIGILDSNKKGVSLLRSLIKLTEGKPCIRMQLGDNFPLGFGESFYGIGSAAKG